MGLERYFDKTTLNYPEIEKPVESLQKALARLIDQPESCPVYDEVTMEMLELTSGQTEDPVFVNSDAGDAYCCRSLAMRRQAVALHRSLCPDFSKHPLKEIE